MSTETLSLFGGLGALIALFALAIIAIVVNDEPPLFIYLIGIVLACFSVILLTKAGV
jgi:hypothetical protein